MLFARSHDWTRTQKCIIAAAVILGVAAFSAAVYNYERYHRGPTEQIFFGTWEAIDFLPEETYFRFNADQTFSLGAVLDGAFTPFIDGKWYAGGPNFYLRLSADDMGESQRVEIFPFVDIKSDEFLLRSPWHVITFRRVTLQAQPKPSNQTLEATATR